MKKPKLRSVKPNVGIEAAYRAKLIKIIREMDHSVQHWITTSYRNNEPRIARDDEMPANALKKQIDRLVRQWEKRFDAMAKKLATHFSEDVEKRSSAGLQRILRDGGLTISKFTMTATQRDVMKATVNENVSLIRSIPSQYFTQIEGMVMRSTQRGGKLDELTKDLRHQYGVTKRRAALIARDQNTKAMSNFTHARYDEIGITEAIWVHSTAGREPRPSHVQAGKDKVRYNVKKGWYDPHEKKWIIPGQLINCRCISQPIVVGFNA